MPGPGMHPVRCHHPRGFERREGSAHMADMAYVVLLIGVFLLLALTVRGLGRL